MNNLNSTPNLFGLALLAMIAAGSSSAEDQACDDRDSAQAWGIWCGVEDYLVRLTEETPPAASGATVNADEPPVEVVDVSDTDRFGGDPEIELDEPVPPIALPDGEEVYYRARYVSQSTSPGASQTMSPDGVGTMELNLPPAGSTSRASNVAISGRDLDAAGVQDDQFNFDAASGDYRFIRVSLDDSKQVQSQFSAGVRSGPGTPPGSRDLRIELIDGKEQVTKNAAQVLKAYWVGARSDVALTANGNSGYTTSGTFNSFVGGQLTPLADIQNLIAGQVVAVYSGASQQLGQTVDISVDFAAQTFNGNWSGGQVPSQPGIDPSFTASGVVQGQHIVATSFGSGVSGQLQGSFFQPDAQALGGAYDVEKVGVGQFNDTFSTTKVVP